MLYHRKTNCVGFLDLLKIQIFKAQKLSRARHHLLTTSMSSLVIRPRWRVSNISTHFSEKGAAVVKMQERWKVDTQTCMLRILDKLYMRQNFLLQSIALLQDTTQATS
jgi:hypothetical protein